MGIFVNFLQQQAREQVAGHGNFEFIPGHGFSVKENLCNHAGHCVTHILQVEVKKKGVSAIPGNLRHIFMADNGRYSGEFQRFTCPVP